MQELQHESNPVLFSVPATGSVSMAQYVPRTCQLTYNSWWHSTFKSQGLFILTCASCLESLLLAYTNWFTATVAIQGTVL
eukprot:20830-Amphidinium_carterae.1